MEDYRGGKTSKERMKSFKSDKPILSKATNKAPIKGGDFAKNRALNAKIEMKSADTATNTRKK